MTRYNVMYGAYVRAYADHSFDAPDDESAVKQAIASFSGAADALDWTDYDYSNLALPSIVSIAPEGPGTEIVTGLDFAATPQDARDMASSAMFEALQRWAQWLAAEDGPAKDILLAQAIRLTHDVLSEIKAEEGDTPPAPPGET